MDMNSKWMNKTFLALSIQMVMGVAFAAEEPALGEYETVDEEVVVETAASVPAQTGQVETQTAEESELGGYEAVEEAAVETAAPVETQAGQVVDALKLYSNKKEMLLRQLTWKKYLRQMNANTL